ncbi:MAG TPA: DUF4389 domain-containing protein [Prolixibacteraceae bacterium]|nr:DUF4389 domain-containing protein [Prolixibacteraceae bacterium]
MKFSINHQERYSRGELLLRTLFGVIYIGIPHGFLLFFVGLWAGVLQFLAFFAVLFTGKFPKAMFNYQVGLITWVLRLNARLLNLSDGYPAFGLKAVDKNVVFEIEYPEKLSRGHLLLRFFFGYFYILIPHGFILFFRQLWALILIFLSWWSVLFTGKYPKGFFAWIEGTLRWQTRVLIYTMFMTDKYPAFTGESLADE